MTPAPFADVRPGTGVFTGVHGRLRSLDQSLVIQNVLSIQLKSQRAVVERRDAP